MSPGRLAPAAARSWNCGPGGSAGGVLVLHDLAPGRRVFGIVRAGRAVRGDDSPQAQRFYSQRRKLVNRRRPASGAAAGASPPGQAA